MDFLRQLVSKQKIRFKDNKYNLDLTYITPRIIAMGFPASGMEGLYRNRMQDVANFLQDRHGDNYRVVNTSSRTYDYSKFGDRVVDVEWPNHHPCRFYYFCRLVLETARVLVETGPETVVVVHCLGGKGRTGSLIGCLLQMAGKRATIEQCNDYYGSKRGVQVGYPSQIRYMVKFRYYFLKGEEAVDSSLKRPVSFSIRTREASFFQGKVFNFLISDFKDKDTPVMQRTFSAVFREDEKQEEPSEG